MIRLTLGAAGVVTAAMLALSAPALAQTPPSPPADKVAQMFARTDTNHDGVITQDEWLAAGRRARGFAFIDANHDGRVTLDEMRAAAARFGY